MRFISTRSKETASGAEAILRGIAKDGGLYVPEEFPEMKDLIQDGLPYEKICHKILDQFFSELELKEQEIKQGYESFALENNGAVKKVGDRYVLELFHGPTAAFKDFALQILPLLLQKSKRYLKDPNRTLILTATSGDTGKAALEGFANLEGMDTGIDVLVLYPSEGVSPIQKQQMITQEGKNVVVLGIEGDFDDAQTAVKQAFLNKKLQQELLEHKIQLSSANSINIGRLVPQIAYYFFAYNELMRLGEIRQGEKISFSVPTGNFGDILAGFYAKKMGLPVDQLICASNENKILKEFFETGIYDRRRSLIQTASPSMDIIISSNLERLLFHALEDSEAVGAYMKQLDQEGIYTLSEEQREKLISLGIQGGYLKMPASYEAIGEVYSDYGYLLDPHTAIAWGVASEKNIASKMVVLSTANPYKFPGSVCDALHLKYENHMDSMDKLQEYTKVPLPMSILFVLGKKPLHQKVIQHQALEEEIRAWLHGGKFSVKVPATTANIGPGFDALGIALNLYAEFEFDYEGIDVNNKIQDIDLKLVGVQEEYGGKENLIYRSLVQALTKIETKRIPKALKIYASSDIPISRGLGSSAACIVAGVTAAFEISKLPYSREQVLEIANEIEGHPDNVAPAIYGGFRASTQRDGKVYSQSLAIHNDLKFIAAVPSFMLSTEKARGVLPKEVPFQDAVFNVSNVALLLGCFQNRDYQGLAVALEDSLHQNYRLPLIQGGAEVLKKAATSRGAYVSGAGPTIMILDENSEKYQDLLSDEIWNVFELQVDFSGTKVEGII